MASHPFFNPMFYTYILEAETIQVSDTSVTPPASSSRCRCQNRSKILLSILSIFQAGAASVLLRS
jgi:hypothetical protein